MEIYATSQNFVEYGIIQQEWEQENKSFIIHTEPPHEPINYTKYTIKLDLSDSDWLKINTHFIDYEASSDNIENEHIITNKTYIQDIEQQISTNKYYRANVMDLIELGCQFNQDSYAQYMSFMLSSENKLFVNLVNNFNDAARNFSFPFFKYILVNNAEGNPENCFFTFVNIVDGDSKLAVKVNFSNGDKEYYDFSDHPL